MLSYPSGMTVSNRALIMLADLLRAHRTKLRTRWRRLDAGQQALLTVAHLRKGETYADLACGFRIGTSTVYRYLREALELLAAMAPTLAEAIAVAAGKAYVILDGTLLRIDRVGMTGGRDRPYSLRETQGPRAERASTRRPRRTADLDLTAAARRPTRHGRRARARHHRRAQRRGHLDDRRHRLSGWRPGGTGAATASSSRPDTGRYRRLSRNQKQVNTAHARQRGPGERANAELKNWKILRKIRSSPNRGAELVAAVQTLMIASA